MSRGKKVPRDSGSRGRHGGNDLASNLLSAKAIGHFKAVLNVTKVGSYNMKIRIEVTRQTKGGNVPAVM